jgi:DNA-binding NarL/FixJ family response regulator
MEPLVPTPARADAAKISVMIVEDDDSIRESLCRWIRKADGFVCLGEFPDAESAVPAILQNKPNVVLVDINLPGLSGIQCVHTLKPQLPATQFVMVTVYEDATHIFDALAAGATGYLLKRTTREALIAALREVHAGGSPMTSNIARKVVQSLHQAKPRSKAADELSKRENEVLALLAQGYLYKEIAVTMGISVPTVNSFIRRIYEKLHVHSRAQAVAIYADLPGAPRRME